jgi:hypothetical protein
MKKLLLLIPVIVIIGCGLFGGEDFYPLAVGNLWKYTGYSTMQDTSATTVDTTQMMMAENEITGTVQIGGKDAYLSITTVTAYTYIPMVDTVESVDTSYIQESNDTIWSYEAVDDSMPMITMVLPIEQDKTWSQVYGTDTITYTVMAKEDITVSAGTYNNCWKVKMTMSGSDHEAYYWYADGTGMVKYYNENANMNYLMKMWYELTEATL